MISNKHMNHKLPSDLNLGGLQGKSRLRLDCVQEVDDQLNGSTSYIDPSLLAADVGICLGTRRTIEASHSSSSSLGEFGE